jgi:uncharacterized protein (AIM24 family)
VASEYTHYLLPNMKIELLQQPDSTIARVTLNTGEEIVAEAGAMVAMSGYLQASTTLRQGKGGGIFRRTQTNDGWRVAILSVFRSPTPENTLFLAPKCWAICCTIKWAQVA